MQKPDAPPSLFHGQELYISANPEITLFKSMYRRVPCLVDDDVDDEHERCPSTETPVQ